MQKVINVTVNPAYAGATVPVCGSVTLQRVETPCYLSRGAHRKLCETYGTAAMIGIRDKYRI